VCRVSARAAIDVRRRGASANHARLLAHSDVRFDHRACQIERRCARISIGSALARIVANLRRGHPGPDSAYEPGRGSTDLRQAIIDQRNCAFKPPVTVAMAGGVLEILNSDPLLHNVRADRDSQSVFNFAMPIEGMRSRRQLPPEPAILRLHCDVHPWMKAVIRTFDHSYFALSDETGAYRLGKVPSGQHKLVFWHSRLPQQSVDVKLSDRPAVQDVLWSATDVAAQ